MSMTIHCTGHLLPDISPSEQLKVSVSGSTVIISHKPDKSAVN